MVNEESKNYEPVLSKLNSIFWKRYVPLVVPSSDEDYSKLVGHFRMRSLVSLFSLANKKELLNFVKNSDSISRLLLFLVMNLSGVSQYYGLGGYKKAKLTLALESILNENPESFNDSNNPILKSFLLNKFSMQPSYDYDLQTSDTDFRNKVGSELQKRRRLVKYLHDSLDKQYSLEHIIIDDSRIILNIVRKKDKKLIAKREKTIGTPNPSERIIVINWKQNIISIPKYNRKEIISFLNFFRFKTKIGVKKIEYSENINPCIPEDLLDCIKEIKTQILDDLNSSVHLKSGSVEPITLSDSLKELIRKIKYSKLNKLTIIKDGKKVNLRLITGNDFFFRPIVMKSDATTDLSFFGLECKKKHLKLNPANLTNEVVRVSLDTLLVRDFECSKIQPAIEKLRNHKLVDFLPDQKRICVNKDCNFRREISYSKNRRYNYLCPECREKTFFKEDVLTLKPNLTKIATFCLTKLIDYEKSGKLNLEITDSHFSLKEKNKRKTHTFIELKDKNENEKRLNIFFANKFLLPKVRSFARSQITPYIIFVIGPVSTEDEREVKFSELCIALIGEEGHNFISRLFEGSQNYEKWREELIGEALYNIDNSKNWSEFEDAVFVCMQYLFPSCIKLGKRYSGKEYPDGFGRFVSDGSNILFGWDAKFTKGSYKFRENPSKHYKYLKFLSRKGNLKHYLIISNNLPEDKFRAVFENRRKYKKIPISLISSQLVKDFVSLIRKEGYNVLDLDLRSKLLNVLFSNLNGSTNYFVDFNLIQDQVKKLIDEKKKQHSSISMDR